MKFKSAKRFLSYLGLLGSARKLKTLYESAENKFLQFAFPGGKFITCNSIARVYADFRDDNFRWYYGFNKFLDQEHQAFVDLLKNRNADIVLDIGAHWGIFPALINGDDTINNLPNKIICVEPDPINLPILRKTVSQIKRVKVELVDCAISDRDDLINAHRKGGSCLQTYSAPINDAKNITIKALTLRTMLHELGIKSSSITHIKLDIDGYEPAFIMGNHELLMEIKPLIMAEFWAKGLMRNSDYSLKEYWGHLNEFYNITLIEYPSGCRIDLTSNDLEFLVQKTMNAVANIILEPRI